MKKIPIAAVLLGTIWLIALAAPEATSVEAARLNNLGAAYMNQQLFEKALQSFRKAETLDPKLQAARLNEGIALLNLGKVDEARPILEETVKRDPKNAHAWYNLGLLYKNSATPQAAVDAFKRVSEIDPTDADTWYFLGAAYTQTKQLQQAEDAFQQALKVNPLHASAQFGLARALQQAGDAAQAKEHLTRFQYITQNKLGSPISLAYGEQGKYSLAEEAPQAPPKVPAQIPVKFVDVTKEADIRIVSDELRLNSGSELFGPGACFLDYDGDGWQDIFLARSGGNAGIALYRNNSHGKFVDVTRAAGLNPDLHGAACAAGDLNNDGATDIAVTANGLLRLWDNDKNGKFSDVTKELSGYRQEKVRDAPEDLSPVLIDYDHDGDLDLFATSFGIWLSSGRSLPDVKINTMWRNNGNGTFTDVTEALGLQLPSPDIAAIGSDYNNDRAVDLVMTGGLKAPLIFENPREGAFHRRDFWADHPLIETRGVTVLDFDHNGGMDLAFTQGIAPGLSLWRNNGGKSFEPVSLPSTNWIRAFGIAAFDYDNDGWVDLAAVGETKDGKAEVRLFRNLGPDGFKDVTSDVGLDKIDLKGPRALVTADYDNDGATDLLITQNQGPAVLLRNVGGNKNHWLKLSLKGLNDNKSAIGTKIEVFAGGNRQKFEIAGSNGYLGQNSTDIVIGLGDSSQADVVRMLWPTGVLQDEIEVAGNRLQKFTEIDRRGSSCPTLFVWNGHEYELVGDMLGAGVVGHWVAPGQRNIPRPTEYIKINRDSVQLRDNRLSFRFMEPLEESVYLDRVRLLAVDHPSTVDVYPNEYFASNPPYPTFKVVASEPAKTAPPSSATDEHGHNLLPYLLAHKFVGDFELLSFPGFAKMHTLELDLGDPYRGGPLWLLMHGEIEYFTATSMYAADQAGLQPVAPFVEAFGSDGRWAKVIDDFGFPAGGPRTMTADLSGKLPPGTRKIRVTTNLQIYWDNILISRTPQDQSVRLTPIPLSRANLDFHGFPLKIENQPPGNVKYVYEKASATGPYTRPAGAYTRYGDVLPLLTSYDDRLAVLGSGDEVQLEFDPSALPRLPKGWTRDYFFAADGYEKDMDFYAYEGNQVAPMPFRAMETYPSSRPLPGNPAYQDYLLKYNTRWMSGREARGFAFDYPH